MLPVKSALGFLVCHAATVVDRLKRIPVNSGCVNNMMPDEIYAHSHNLVIELGRGTKPLPVVLPIRTLD